MQLMLSEAHQMKSLKITGNSQDMHEMSVLDPITELLLILCLLIVSRQSLVALGLLVSRDRCDLGGATVDREVPVVTTALIFIWSMKL